MSFFGSIRDAKRLPNRVGDFEIGIVTTAPGLLVFQERETEIILWIGKSNRAA
jgi:hypothetical protein